MQYGENERSGLLNGLSKNATKACDVERLAEGSERERKRKQRDSPIQRWREGKNAKKRKGKEASLTGAILTRLSSLRLYYSI